MFGLALIPDPDPEARYDPRRKVPHIFNPSDELLNRPPLSYPTSPEIINIYTCLNQSVLHALHIEPHLIPTLPAQTPTTLPQNVLPPMARQDFGLIDMEDEVMGEAHCGRVTLPH